jgi:hypothetical protein
MGLVAGSAKMVAVKLCRPWTVSGSMPGRVPGVCETDLGYSKCSLLWKIPGADILRGYEKPALRKGLCPWARIYINDRD